jgi:hypothetical protein
MSEHLTTNAIVRIAVLLINSRTKSGEPDFFRFQFYLLIFKSINVSVCVCLYSACACACHLIAFVRQVCVCVYVSLRAFVRVLV